MERLLLVDAEHCSNDDTDCWKEFQYKYQSLIKKNFMFIALQIVILISLFLFLIFWNRSLLLPFHKESNLKYTILIDAGSHGSRLHIYSYSLLTKMKPLSGSREIIIPTEVFSISHSKSINNISLEDFSKVPELCLENLIVEAKNFLVQHRIKNWAAVPIHLKATAGMRNVDALTRSRIMNGIREYFSNKTLVPFLFHPDWARVIAGEEEGVYGWIAVNNANNTLFESPQNTVGAVDLGGSSAQITFFPKHTSVLEDYYGLALGDKVIRLYSHSYIGYGWDDALSRLTTKLALDLILDPATKNKIVQSKNSSLWTSQGSSIENAEIEEIVLVKGSHPCYPSGTTVEFPMPSLVYPEGRFYIDIPYDTLHQYMSRLGIPKKYHWVIIKNKMVRSNFIYEDDLTNGWTTDASSTEQDLNIMKTRTHPSAHPPDTILQLNVQETESHNSVKKKRNNSPHVFTPLDVPLPLQGAARKKFVVTFKGTSDIHHCVDLAERLFYDFPCFIHSCSFNGVYQPRLEDSKFIALGQMRKIQQTLNLSSHTGLGDLFQAALQICSKSREELVQEWRLGRYPLFGKKGLVKLCWKTIWATTLLTRGLGFPNTSQSSNNPLQFDQSVLMNSSLSTGWGIGSVIYEINRTPFIGHRVEHSGYLVVVLLSLLTLGVSLYFLWKQVYLYQRIVRRVENSQALPLSNSLNPKNNYILLH